MDELIKNRTTEYLAKEFLLHQQSVKRVSMKTSAGLELTLTRLCAALPTRANNVNLEHLERWVAALNGRLGPGSVDLYIRQARQFFRWAFSRGLVTQDPTQGLRGPRPPSKKKDTGQIIVADQMRELLAELDPALAPVVVSLWGTGLRQSELRSLRTNEIHAEHMALHVREGKSASRDVPIIDHSILSALLACAGGGLPTRRQLQANFTLALQHIGVPRLTVHRLRDSRISLWLADYPVVDVMRWVGHRKMETTLRYAHPLHRSMGIGMQPSGLVGAYNGV